MWSPCTPSSATMCMPMCIADMLRFKALWHIPCLHIMFTECSKYSPSFHILLFNHSFYHPLLTFIYAIVFCGILFFFIIKSVPLFCELLGRFRVFGALMPTISFSFFIFLLPMFYLFSFPV